MSIQEPFDQLARFAAIGLLLAALFGLFVWAGATPGDPLESEAPNEVVVTPDRQSYVGERVVLGGRVVDTDPVVLATQASGYGRFTLVDADAHVQNRDEPLEEGDRISAYGTLEDEETLAVELVTVQNPGETAYMLVVSLLGGLWVTGRCLRHWRFDPARLAFVPRESGVGDDERDRFESTASDDHARTRDGRGSIRGERDD